MFENEILRVVIPVSVIIIAFLLLFFNYQREMRQEEEVAAQKMVDIRGQMRNFLTEIRSLVNRHVLVDILKIDNGRYFLMFEDGSVYRFKFYRYYDTYECELCRVYRNAWNTISPEEIHKKYHLEEVYSDEIPASVHEEIGSYEVNFERWGLSEIKKLVDVLEEIHVQTKRLCDGVLQEEIQDFMTRSEFNDKINLTLGEYNV